MHNSNVIILGAGICGLILAKKLQNHGFKVKVLDKGRGVGGRMATRRFGGGRVDHGAQFFTARGDNMRAVLSDPAVKDVVRVWSKGFATSTAGEAFEDGHPRYMALNGMSSIPKALAKGLDIQTSVKIDLTERKDSSWALKSAEGEFFNADLLIMTCPAEQALRLLHHGEVQLNSNEEKILKNINYHPSIALMVKISGESKIPKPGGIRFDSGPISWIADNTQKGLPTQNPDESLITIHSDPLFAEENWEEDLSIAAQKLLEEAKAWVGDSVVECQPHRWRYSLSLQKMEPGFLKLSGPPIGYIAGDGFGGGKIEGAVNSAFATFQALIESES